MCCFCWTWDCTYEYFTFCRIHDVQCHLDRIHGVFTGKCEEGEKIVRKRESLLWYGLIYLFTILDNIWSLMMKSGVYWLFWFGWSLSTKMFEVNSHYFLFTGVIPWIACFWKLHFCWLVIYLIFKKWCWFCMPLPYNLLARKWQNFLYQSLR